MSHGQMNPVLAADAEPIPAHHLLVIDQRYKEIRGEKYYSPVEFCRRDAENGKRMFVHLHNAPNHAAIVLKMAVPICIREHDIGGAVGTMLIGAVEETAKIRLNA